MTLINLRAYIRFLTATSSVDYSDSDINFNVNRAIHEFNAMILSAIDGWSDTEKATSQDLVANQQSYVFPTGIIRIKRIEIDFEGNGKFIHVPIIDINDRSGGSDATSIAERFNTAEPFADVSDKINLLPIPPIAVTNGLKVWHEADATELSSDSDEPTFVEAFHPWISFSSSRDYFIKTDQDERGGRMEIRMEKLFAKAKNFYGIRSGQKTLVRSGSDNDQYSNE